MGYRLEFKPSAADALAKIPQRQRVRIAKKIDQLAANPRPRGAIKLEGTALYRFRSGEYRIIYQVDDDRLVVLVVRVGGRGDVYRHLP
jgi:mRNA interferase RelE/StbE